MNVDLLKSLCEIPGIPGREERVRAFIEEEIDGLYLKNTQMDFPIRELLGEKSSVC